MWPEHYEPPGLDRPVNEIDPKIQSIAQSAGVLPAAVYFVFQCFPANDAYGVMPPISVKQFCWRVHDIALQNYQQEARAQLEQWKIDSTETIGRIVLGLTREGLLRSSAVEDLSSMVEHYKEVFDFSNAFVERHFDPPPPMNRWTIGGIFGVMTAVSVAMPGVKSLGLAGGIATLLGIWLAIIGAACMVMAIRSGMRGKWFVLPLGVIFLTLGISIYVLVAIK